MSYRFPFLFPFVFAVLLVVGSHFFAFAQGPPTSSPSPSSSDSPSPSFSFTPPPSVTPTPSPGITPSPTPTSSEGPTSPCSALWELDLEYDPSQAVRNGTVYFTLTFPVDSKFFGHTPDNPTLLDAYQYPHTVVRDSALVITSRTSEGKAYTGYILMKSADVVVMKYDLWCPPASVSPGLARTYTWTIPSSAVPVPSPTPNASISDIRYISFDVALDADAYNDPVGIAVQSQVQLRNLKSNL